MAPVVLPGVAMVPQTHSSPFMTPFPPLSKSWRKPWIFIFEFGAQIFLFQSFVVRLFVQKPSSPLPPISNGRAILPSWGYKRWTLRFKGSIEASPTSSTRSLRQQQTVTKSAPTSVVYSSTPVMPKVLRVLSPLAHSRVPFIRPWHCVW